MALFFSRGSMVEKLRLCERLCERLLKRLRERFNFWLKLMRHGFVLFEGKYG